MQEMRYRNRIYMDFEPRNNRIYQLVNQSSFVGMFGQLLGGNLEKFNNDLKEILQEYRQNLSSCDISNMRIAEIFCKVESIKRQRNMFAYLDFKEKCVYFSGTETCVNEFKEFLSL